MSSTDPHSATQIYRKVQEGQTAEHVARIQALEARVAELEGELTVLRRGGGTEEVQALPGEALRVLLGVFDAVPIPDLGAWERRQCVQRLTSVLQELEARGELASGTWSGGEAPAAQVAEGDGAAAARLTTQVVRVLGEVASKYLAQMIEFQGTTPDQVARARASHLMDASSLVDAKAQYGLLPGDSQRALFEQHIDQLVTAKDQLYVLGQWVAEARELTRQLVVRRGLKAPREASLLGLLRLLADQDEAGQAPALAEVVHGLVRAYAALLPERDVLELLELADSEFQRAHASTVSADASEPGELPFLAGALEAVLTDHEAVAAALKETALKAREKKALSRLDRSLTTAAKASDALARLGGQRAAVEAAHGEEEALQRTVVKRFAAALEREARARIAASPRPEASATAFEQLSKAERTAHLAALFSTLVGELSHLLEDPQEGLAAHEARLQEALRAAGTDPALLARRRSELEAVAELLRSGDGDEEAFDLSVGAAIDVEEGLLARQEQELAARVEELLGKYSRARVGTLAEAAEKLAEVEAQSRGKKAALDALLKKAHKGKLSPKREAETAQALLDEQTAVEEGRRRLELRKGAAFERVRGRLAEVGLDGLTTFDHAWARLAEALESVRAAETARAALGERVAQIRDLAARLQGEPLPNAAAARALCASAQDDVRALAERAQAVEEARAAYLEEANRGLRKRAGHFDAARLAIDEVARELDTVARLRAAAEAYTRGFGGFRRELGALDKARAWVARERKKAAQLGQELAAAAESARRAADKLGGAAPPE